jgi:predicted dehydrogenase
MRPRTGKVIKFGIVGTGRMAATMMGAFSQSPNIEVAAVSSGSQDRAREFADRFSIQSSYGSFRELLGDDAIAAVYIANRNVDHCSTAIAALSAGKSVLCEKPFAINVKEGQAVIAAARTAGKLFMEAMWTPFLPAYERLRSLVQSGSFGKPTHVRFDFGYPTSAESHPSLFARNGGGVLLDRSPYGIAVALRILGEAKIIGAAVDVNDAGVDLNASLQLTHKGGGQSQLGFSLTSLMSNSATVSCESGMVGLAPPTIGAETVLFQHAFANRPHGIAAGRAGLKQRVVQNLRRHALVRRAKASVSGPKKEYLSFGAEPYAHQLRHFVELLHSGRTESDVNTLDSSLAVLQIIEAAKTLPQTALIELA